MLAGCAVGLRFGLSHYVAVFDAPMRRIYRATGWPPEVIAEDGEGRNKLCLGLWEITEAARDAVLPRTQGDLALDDIPAPLPDAAPRRRAAEEADAARAA